MVQYAVVVLSNCCTYRSLNRLREPLESLHGAWEIEEKER
jgi:hypothetical protein